MFYLFTFITYNIHHGVDTSGNNTLNKMAHALKTHSPDFLSLNEVDKFVPRSCFTNQAKYFGDKLNMYWIFGKSLKLFSGQYGNALVSKYIPLWVYNHLLPGTGEQRSCLDVLYLTTKGKVRVLCTHLGLDEESRKKQIIYINNLLSINTIPTILAGDINFDITKTNIKFSGLKDVYSLTCSTTLNTFPALNPLNRLDFIFISSHFTWETVLIPPWNYSDHRPLITRLNLKSCPIKLMKTNSKSILLLNKKI